MATISKREHIRWPPAEVYENTFTQVLTSPERHFVDIRIFILSPEPFRTVVAPLSHVDWAFAGKSSSTWVRSSDSGSSKAEPEPEQPQTHSVWVHWVDSRHEDASTVVDEADMFPREDGLALEKGRMVNPFTGIMADYEELWRDMPVLEAENMGSGQVVVLSAEGLGMVVRVGRWCQGILRMGDAVSVEMWVYGEGMDGWSRMFRAGDHWMPCGAAMESEELVVGGKIVQNLVVWDVLEVS